jgi:hypothetical protein
MVVPAPSSPPASKLVTGSSMKRFGGRSDDKLARRHARRATRSASPVDPRTCHHRAGPHPMPHGQDLIAGYGGYCFGGLSVLRALRPEGRLSSRNRPFLCPARARALPSQFSSCRFQREHGQGPASPMAGGMSPQRRCDSPILSTDTIFGAWRLRLPLSKADS